MRQVATIFPLHGTRPAVQQEINHTTAYPTKPFQLQLVMFTFTYKQLPRLLLLIVLHV